MKNQHEIASRSWLAFIFFAVIGLSVFGRILFIQIWQADKWSEQASSIEQRVQDIEPTRGQIYSTDGSLLATSVPVYDLYWDSKANGIQEDEFVRMVDTLCLELSIKFNDRTPAEYRQLLLEAKRLEKRYQKVIKRMSYTEMKEVKNFPLINKGRHRSGFIFEKVEIRKKPFRQLASRTIGIDRYGSRVGLELAYNEELSGKVGKQMMERIAGNVWKPATDSYIEDPVDGVDIVSSIDIHLQDVASTELEKMLRQHGGDWGTVVLMEVETGYVRAIANLAYDDEDDRFYESYNYAIGEAVEPGSTFKLASMIALLDEGYVTLQDSVDTGDGVVEFYGEDMSDSGDEGYGKITIEQVFEKSSNVGTAILLDRHFSQNPQAFLDKLGDMGLRNPLGINLKGEADPKIYSKVREGNWSGLSLTQMSIGYEVLQTPLQQLALYNAIANDGTMMKPLFVESFTKNGKTIEEIKPITLRERICKRETIDDLFTMMEGVCEEGGTADYVFKNSPYRVAGKTGTAKIAYPGGYYRNRYRSSFVGFFPADNPKYSCIVVINDTKKGVYYGSAIAAPVFRGLANKIYATQLELHQDIGPNYLVGNQTKLPVSRDGAVEDLETVYAGLNIPMRLQNESVWASISTKEDHVEINDRPQRKGLVPNVVGMGLQDALYLLENAGMRVEVTGVGTVKRQSVVAGASLKNHRNIRIELS